MRLIQIYHACPLRAWHREELLASVHARTQSTCRRSARCRRTGHEVNAWDGIGQRAVGALKSCAKLRCVHRYYCWCSHAAGDSLRPAVLMPACHMRYRRTSLIQVRCASIAKGAKKLRHICVPNTYVSRIILLLLRVCCQKEEKSCELECLL